MINQSCVSIPSYQCQPGDSLSIKNSKSSQNLVKEYLESPALSNIPQHLDFDSKALTAKVLGIVGRDGGYTKQKGDCVVLIPTVDAEKITPLAEAFQGVVWHCFVSHPGLQVLQTKW